MIKIFYIGTYCIECLFEIILINNKERNTMSTLTAKQINTKINGLKTAELKGRDRIQELIVATRDHAMEHGDLTLLSRLVTVLKETKARNLKAITQYIIDHTKGIEWRTGKNQGYVKAKNATIEFIELADTWYNYQANKASQEVAKVDPLAKVTRLLKTLTQALDDGKVEDKEQAERILKGLQGLVTAK